MSFVIPRAARIKPIAVATNRSHLAAAAAATSTAESRFNAFFGRSSAGVWRLVPGAPRNFRSQPSLELALRFD